MNSLNNLIDTAGKFTGHTEGIPATDHSEQMNYAMGYTARASEAAKLPPQPAPEALKPIVPFAN